MAVWSFQVWTRKVSFANTVGENKNHIAQQTHVRQTYFQRAFLVWKSQSWVYKLRVLVYIRFFLFSFFNFFFSHQILSILYKANPLVYPFHSFRSVLKFHSLYLNPLSLSLSLSLNNVGSEDSNWILEDMGRRA